jgi:hypothetical protein
MRVHIVTRADAEVDRGADDNEGEVPSPEGEGGAPKKLAAPRTRRKLTGVELEARFDGWRSERHAQRAARTSEDGARTLRRAVGSTMGAAIVALVVTSAVTSNRFEATQSANATRITSLQWRVADAQAAPADAHLSEKMTKLSEAAAADAGKVRDAQQAYATLYRRASTQPGTDNGAPNGAMIATAEHGRVLAPLFDRKSYLVDDKDAYTWQNVVPFDTNSKIDPRFAWYVRYDGWAASDPSAYSWKVETVMPGLDSQDASGATSKAKVVWLCREAQAGDVLAWASATYTYDGQNGVFDDLDVVVTAAGAKHENPASTSRDGSDIPELSGLGAATKDEKDGTR